MALATVSDVETSLMRELTPTESQYVEPLLERAERMLASRIPDLGDVGSLDPSRASLFGDVVAEMVARVFRAPDNGLYRRETEGNYTYDLNLKVASGLLDVLPEEWERLGVGSWGQISPEVDGYARSRYGLGHQPHWQFQWCWPGQDNISEQWWWGP